MPDLSETLKLLAAVETATIGHVRGEGFMVPAMQCLTEGMRIAGPALTANLPGDDGAALPRAIAAARPGDILVVGRPDDDRHACWGAVMTAAALAAGIAGVVIDGYVTDVSAIRASGLPVWCLGRSPVTTKNRRGGAVNVPVRCGGVAVRPGDVVLADENGVLVMAAEEAHGLALDALAIQADEPGLIARIEAGEQLAAIYAAKYGA